MPNSSRANSEETVDQQPHGHEESNQSVAQRGTQSELDTTTGANVWHIGGFTIAIFSQNIAEVSKSPECSMSL